MTWGLEAKTLRIFYDAVVVPTLLYGCSVWVAAVKYKWCKKLLRQTQRMILRCIVRSFKSVATLSLIVMSNCLPIDLKAVEISVSRFFLLKDYAFTPSSLAAISWVLGQFDANFVFEKAQKFHSKEFPPWFEIPLPDCSSTPNSNPLETLFDGSTLLESQKIFTFVRKGAVELLICTPGGLLSYKEDLPRHASKLQANSLALNRALHFVGLHYSSAHQNACWEIISESRSALNATLSDGKMTGLVHETRHLFLTVTKHTALKFLIYAGLNGVTVSEFCANFPVENAGEFLCLSALPDGIPHSKQSFNQLNHHIIQQLWSEEWTDSQKGKETKRFFPMPSDAAILKRRSCMPHQLTQILTGHGVMNAYQHRINRIDSPACSCGATAETTDHFLFFCPIFEVQRSKLRLVCQAAGFSFPPPLHVFPKNNMLWSSFLKFIMSTKRLDCLK